MDQFTLLVFDWDGTLMDSTAGIIVCVGLAATNLNREVPSDDAIRNIIGLGLKESVMELFPGSDDAQVWRVVERYRRHYFDRDRTMSELFPGAENVLRELHGQGFMMAVATGKGREGLDKVLAHTGLEELFHTSRCADEAFSKPHPDMLLQIMDELGVDGGETLMVGDTEYDMQMANSASANRLAVSYGAHEYQRLMQHDPLGCLDDIRDIIPWLQTYGVNS